MQRLPAWLWPLPVWLWPRSISATPNGLQRLGRALHWCCTGLALSLGVTSAFLAVSAAIPMASAATVLILGTPVPEQFQREIYSIKAPDGRTYTLEGPKAQGQEAVRKALLEQFPRADVGPLTEQEHMEYRGRIEAAPKVLGVKAWLVEHTECASPCSYVHASTTWGFGVGMEAGTPVKTMDALVKRLASPPPPESYGWSSFSQRSAYTSDQTKALARASARLDLRAARASFYDSLGSAVGFALVAIGALFTGRISRYVISGE
jgi:hypothetical protein